jgi:hypothetical protein
MRGNEDAHYSVDVTVLINQTTTIKYIMNSKISDDLICFPHQQLITMMVKIIVYHLFR